MRMALREAEAAAAVGEVPVGGGCGARWPGCWAAVATRQRGCRIPLPMPRFWRSALPQIALGSWRLEDCRLYVTLEPCHMCAGAIVLARIPHLIYAAADPKAGACGSLRNVVQDERLNHQVEILSGIMEAECGELLRSFFRNLRAEGRKRRSDLRPDLRETATELLSGFAECLRLFSLTPLSEECRSG